MRASRVPHQLTTWHPDPLLGIPRPSHVPHIADGHGKIGRRIKFPSSLSEFLRNNILLTAWSTSALVRRDSRGRPAYIARELIRPDFPVTEMDARKGVRGERGWLVEMVATDDQVTDCYRRNVTCDIHGSPWDVRNCHLLPPALTLRLRTSTHPISIHPFLWNRCQEELDVSKMRSHLGQAAWIAGIHGSGATYTPGALSYVCASNV